jgi:nucleotide-binding universal stress UspA family protein
VGGTVKTTDQTALNVPRISRILVATDFPTQVLNALKRARYLADMFGAQLVLLHVIDIFSLAEISCATGRF